MPEDIYANLPRYDVEDVDNNLGGNALTYSVLTTCDGSPTLAIWPRHQLNFDSGQNERMHHPKGAWTETFWIYGQALEKMRGLGWSPAVYVVGLGCGYIELMATAHAMQSPNFFGPARGEFRLRSFESDLFLNHGFLAWLDVDNTSPRFSSLKSLFDEVCRKVGGQFQIPPLDLRRTLFELYRAGRFILDGALKVPLDRNEIVPFRASLMIYDAFSSRTNPELWDENFLNTLVERYAEPQAIFVSYAARGVLNRALRRQGFEIEKIPGYGGKRESTVAVRSGAPEILT